MSQNARLIFPNMATDPVVHAWAEKTLPDLCAQARTQRKTKEERWLHFWKLWSVELDQPSYEGRSQVYPGQRTARPRDVAGGPPPDALPEHGLVPRAPGQGY